MLDVSTLLANLRLFMHKSGNVVTEELMHIAIYPTVGLFEIADDVTTA